ncbi:SpaH/EbpB family LPXTG-anchored major pilin [Clostridium perfringens]|uniref:SpaH/EbpB family LPXTG-anchored major pilin n=1 Tax=Clostridium perfringens TaxID=1502 RepID=UPI0010DBD5AA|nr:SpaH/EbpB family LPXTG-anchored major pilin [Clostridium perfringens]VTQ54240.1 surface protein [Clostridium perfringens]
MDKLIKKMSLMLSSVLMILTFSVPVFAKTIPTPSIDKDAPKTGSITITKEGAGFTAYQVLKATQSGDAYDYTATDNFKGFFNNDKYGNYTENQIKDLTTTDDIKEFASQLHKYAIDNKISNGIQVNSGVKTNVDLGYYLVLETSEQSTGNAVVSTAMLVSVPQVENDKWNYNVTLNPKDNAPSIEKKIIENNKLVDTSSANIGDTIKYKVTATIPTYEKNATNIVYKIKDTMSKGLTYDSNSGIKITSRNKTFVENTDYTVKFNKILDGTTNIEIDFVYDNIKAYATDGLTLEYQATLNENALIDTKVNEGNPNNITLEYTNNPDIQNSNKTINDKVTSYTWGFGVKKVDSENITKDLAGAEFSVRDANKNIVGKYTYNESGNVVILQGNGVTNENGVVTFTGLKEGDYFITEEKAPKGYSLLKEPVKVTITAQKDSNGDYTGQATIAVTNGNEAGSIVNNINMNDKNVLFNVQIKNYAGVSLPGTGGIGTNGFVKIAIGLLAVVVVLGVGYIAIDKAKQA